jgi:hypothetical protein
LAFLGIEVEFGPLGVGQLVGDLAYSDRLEQSQAAQQAFLALDAFVEFA